MVITWFTDPSGGHFAENPGKFSSYYQYDTTTKKLVRVRLELNREAYGSDTGDTSAFLNDKRYVGFSKVDYVAREAEFPDKDFTIDEKTGRILVKGEALPVKPSVGDSVVDFSKGDVAPHFGNNVSDNVNLPEGISIKHLSLIANEAIITNSNINFTQRTASGVDLSSRLKAKVCDIIGKEDFATISDEDILTKLKAQVTDIKKISVAPSKDSIDRSLEWVENDLKGIQTEIEEGRLTPNQDFLDAFGDFSKSVAKVKTASNTGEGIGAAVEELSVTKTALLASTETLESAQKLQIENSISQYDDAVSMVQSESTNWESISKEYAAAESAETIEDYEKSISSSEETPIEI